MSDQVNGDLVFAAISFLGVTFPRCLDSHAVCCSVKGEVYSTANVFIKLIPHSINGMDIHLLHLLVFQLLGY